MGERPWVLSPTRWELIYPVYPTSPIGEIVLIDDVYVATMQSEELGFFTTGDAAAEAIWERFLEANRVRHEEAAITHGAYERHVRTLDP